MAADLPTIYALATPPGRGALALIRISGMAAKSVLPSLGAVRPPTPRRATLVTLKDPKTGEGLDQAVATFYEGPTSFTGEDVLELALHGGRAVVAGVLDALQNLPGLRLAEPGEFTKRAFMNGKLDLTEAEAVADLIDAQTALQKRQALSQLSGNLSALYEGWRTRLVRALAYLEAHFDFPDEDLPTDLLDRIRPDVTALIAEITAHLEDAHRGERLREGIQVVILGAPNVGKSSLLNALARRDVAIVSDLAGTTRDVLDVHLDLAGFPVTLTDTAGLREIAEGAGGHDAVEREGIRRALDRAARADLKILVFDGTSAPDAETLAQRDNNSLVVINKADLVSPPPAYPEKTIPLSAKTGAGLEALLTAITDWLQTHMAPGEGATLTRARHRAALTACLEALRAAQTNPTPELTAEDLRTASRQIGRITGRVDVEDLLDVIFRDFCIGK